MRLRLLTGGCAAPNPLTPPLASRCLALASLASYGRLRRPLLLLLSPLPSAASPPPFLPSPRLSRLLWAAAPPLLFASPPALLSGGCAALPLPLLLRFSSASSAAAPPHTTPRSRGRLAPPPLSTLSFLSIKQLTILSVAVTCHEFFFFNHCVNVLGYN